MTSVWHVLAIAVVIAVAPLAGVAAERPLRVHVLAQCARGSACISVEVYVKDFEKRAIADIRNGECGERIVDVRGRLNGGPVRSHRLRFDLDCMPCADSFAAYFGQSAAKHPVIGTSAGRFEIFDPSVTVGAPEDLIVIDEVTGRVVAKYWGNSSAAGGFYFEDGRVYLADAEGPCFLAPRDAPRKFVFAPGHCRDRMRKAFPQYVWFDNLSAPARATLIGLTTPETARQEHLVRIPGTRLLTLQLSDNCYQ